MNRKLIPVISCVAAVLLIIVGITTCGSDKIKLTSKPVDIPKLDKPVIKVFLENSGSMDGYMCPGSQLKDAVYDYVSDLNRFSKSTQLFYINSQIIPYQGQLMSYIKDLNPASFKQGGGNLTSTDLGDILSRVLKTVDNNTVAIFVSDCILDFPSKDAQKYLTNCEIRIKDEIVNARKRTPDLGVEILQLTSDFSGKYFYPSGGQEMLSGVQRPYYIWIFGNRYQLANLNKEVPFSMLKKYNLKGVASFTGESAVPFQMKNAGGGKIKPVHGDYNGGMQVDLRSTLLPTAELENAANYSFKNSQIKVTQIKKIDGEDSPYTHEIYFKIPGGIKVWEETLTLKMPAMPAWVSSTNDDTGTNIRANLSKTTGIKYLIQGVADGFKDTKAAAQMPFSVKSK